MEQISFAQVKDILDTLPVGYYCGRKVKATLDKDADTSYYVPMADEITVAYEQVKIGLNELTSSKELESAIRCLLYHELSHAILTPNTLGERYQCHYKGAMPFDVVNIVEDERIERIMDGFYIDVDFFFQVQRINNFQTDFDPTTADAVVALYHAVRYRQDIGIPKVKSMVTDLLNNFQRLTRNSDGWDSGSYLHNIQRLYDYIRQYYPAPKSTPNNSNSSQSNNKNGNGNGSQSTPNVKKINSPTKGESLPLDFDPTKQQNGGNNTNQQNNQQDNQGQEGQSGQQNTTNPSSNSGNSADSGVASKKAYLGSYVKGILSYGDNTSDGGNWMTTIDRIFSNFHKKNSGGNGLCAYSGVFNPRMVARNDYRYFSKPVVSHGNNQFGTFHLNLFIDCSGSFSDNEQIVNQLIQSLCQLERRNKNFSLDICFLGDGEHYATDYKHKELHADEGTYLDLEAVEIFRKLQKPNTYNYNIVLIDGWAYNQFRQDDPTCPEWFAKSFDHDNTTCILDSECRPLVKNFSRAKVTIVDDSKYTEKLFDNVIRSLTFAFS